MWLQKTKKLIDFTERETVEMLTAVSQVMKKFNLTEVSVGGITVKRKPAVTLKRVGTAQPKE